MNMPRHTPFEASEVYFDYDVLERNKADKRLRVALRVIRKAILGPLVA